MEKIAPQFFRPSSGPGLLSPELRLVLLLAPEHPGPKALAAAEKILRGKMDWPAFETGVCFHKLARPVLTHLGNFPGQVPGTVLDRLKSRVLSQIRQGWVAGQELHRLDAAFGQAGIQVLFFRGLVLSQVLYQDPCARDARDIDLRIRPGDLTQVQALLDGLGYSRLDPEEPGGNAALNAHTRTHAAAIFISPARVVVEVHWRFFAVDGLFPAPFDELWQQRQKVSVFGQRIDTLGPGPTLSLLICHGADHAWGRAFWLKDLADLIQPLPRDRQEEIFRQKGPMAIQAREALALMTEWLGLDLPQPPRTPLRVGPALRVVTALYRGAAGPKMILLEEVHRCLTYPLPLLAAYVRQRRIRRRVKKRAGTGSHFLHLIRTGAWRQP